MKKLASPLALIVLSVLAACGPTEPGASPSSARFTGTPPLRVAEPTATASTAASASAAASPAYGEFNTTATIRDVMNTLVDPNVDILWNAVRYENTDAGEREYKPETADEWTTLRHTAIAIIEGGNALMIPGRRVAPPGSTTDFPEYEFLPDEVQAKLNANRAAWDGFAKGLQAGALQALEAIDARDAEKLSESGEALDAACEACHLQYWYRPDGAAAPKKAAP
jgi:hypothetical protein